MIHLALDGQDTDPTLLRKINQKSFNGDELLVEMAKYTPKILKYATCLKGYSHYRYCNSGTNGVAFFVTKNDVEYVAKIQVSSPGFMHEIRMMNVFSQVGIGVKLYEHCLVQLGDWEDLIGVIIMEKVDGVLEGVKGPVSSDMTDSIGKQLMNMLNIMKEHNISHNDLNLGNIGFIRSDSSLVLKLIDLGFGCSSGFYPDINVLSLGRALFGSRASWARDIRIKYWNSMLAMLSEPVAKEVGFTYDKMNKRYETDFEIFKERIYEREVAEKEPIIQNTPQKRSFSQTQFPIMVKPTQPQRIQVTSTQVFRPPQKRQCIQAPIIPSQYLPTNAPT